MYVIPYLSNPFENHLYKIGDMITATLILSNETNSKSYSTVTKCSLIKRYCYGRGKVHILQQHGMHEIVTKGKGITTYHRDATGNLDALSIISL